MSIRLDPTVADKLQRIGRRRLHLLLVRGFCTAIVAFLAGMAVVAVADWYWVLSDQVRWGLSIAAYAATAGAVWLTSLRRLVRSPAEREIAAHVEVAAPELRENLLSAVELAADDPADIHDSPVFRSLLQGRVAEQMSGVRVPGILPVRLLSRWLLAALVLAAGVGVLLSGSDSRFRILAVRALLPGANIERVSRIHVNIRQPTPTSLTVATDETVAVVVEVSGGTVEDVTLEVFSNDGSSVRQAMRARTETEFAANLHVTADTEYRILAGDAITMRHTIRAKNRPRVVAFQKTYRFPEYSGLPTTSVTEDAGDIVALTGTLTDLTLELDQAVSAAELRIDGAKFGDDVTIIPLQQVDDSRWSATVPVNDPGIYRVRLVSAETGFENVFAPRYEIRPIPDLIPRAGFVDQTEMNLLLPPNDILALRGMAEDDLPLERLDQEISVNGREWQVIPLVVTSADSDRNDDDTRADSAGRERAVYRVDSAWNWDLLKLSLNTGDQVSTRLVATDRQGNRGESVPLRIVVSAPEFDPDRHAVMETKAAVYDHFVQLATIAEQQNSAALEIIARLRDSPDQSEESRALDRTTLAGLSNRLRDAAGDLLDRIPAVTRSMPAGADALELYLAGSLIARMRQEHASRPLAILQSMQHAKDADQMQADLNQLQQAFERSADDAKTAAIHFQQLISHNIVAAAAFDFDALMRRQRLVVESSTQTWPRLLRQETLVRSHLLAVERLLEDQRDRLPDHMRNQVSQLLDWCHQQRDRLDGAMESEDRLQELQQAARGLLTELEQRQRIVEMDGGLPGRLTQARREFDVRSGSLFEPLSQVADAAREELRLRDAAAVASDSEQATELTRQVLRYAAEIDRQHRQSLEQLRIRRDLTQCRIDADAQFAADAGLTSRAVTSLLNQFRANESGDFANPGVVSVPEALKEIAPAYRVLEAGHDFADVISCLDTLIPLERWQSQEITGRTDHPRQWDTIQKNLDEAVNHLRAAGINNELMGRIDQVRWSPPVHEIGRRIGQRRWTFDEIVSAGSDLIDLRDRLQPLNDELQPILAEARAVIAKYAPTIPEMAQQLAGQVRDLEQQTIAAAEAADPAADRSPPDQHTDLPALQREQDRINVQLDDLFEALVEDANQQDLQDSDQRERARDADDSIAFVQPPAERMNAAMQAAQQTPVPEQQANELSTAAEQQEQTAQALELVAEHFDHMRQGQNIAETRAELRRHEQELGIARQMDQKFDPVEQLARDGQRSPKDRMAELEAELQQNPAMQHALSEISRNTIQEARSALQDAAQRDQEIQRANERSHEEFQAKKQQLAEDLRELGRDAAELARHQTSHAHWSASQAKTPEAQRQFSEAQRRLNEAAQAANSANEGELLADLASKLQEAQRAIFDASQQLKSGRQGSAAAKGQEIHADDKARQNAKKSQEDQRGRFLEQRKREADNLIRHRENQERQAEQQVQNFRNNVNNRDQQVQQAKEQLNQKPDDDNRRRQVEQAEARLADAEQKLEQAIVRAEVAAQRTVAERKDRSQLDQIPLPSLDDSNPAAQAAEDYADQAITAADQLAEQARQIAERAEFGSEMTPAQGQLQQAVAQQERVTQDTSQVADDVNRAARHERRLENAVAAEALSRAARNVDRVADNEATQATLQLQAAEQTAPDPSQPDRQSDNLPALAANEKLAVSEQAISEQADALTQILTPMQQAANAAALAQSQPGDASVGDASAGETAGSDQAPSPDSAASQAPPSFTPQQAAAGRQLAQALDSLDRQQSAQSSQSSAMSGLSREMQAQQRQIASARARDRKQSAFASRNQGRQPQGIPAYDGDTGTFVVVPVNRDRSEEWGRLREQAAEDLTRGRREAVSAEYRKSVETYFKVLAERSRKSQ
ncbi:MAG: DUF4175 family protein [Planctomycetaceae bacterium]